jgi:uncharacterized membrane protein YkvA (DUF1232 family)
MADKKRLMIPPQGGVVRDFILRVKLIVRLIRDRRISPWLKLIPIAGVIYLFTPLSIIPDITLPVIGELDDAAVLWITNYFFIELCPPQIVREHVKALNADRSANDDEDDIVDADSIEFKDKKK